MKRMIICLALTIGTACMAEAQEVYNEVRSKAQTAVENATNDLAKQINQFKVDALDYMLIKMREQMPDSTTAFLDKQAYALNNFIGYYMMQMLEMSTMPKVRQVKVMRLFIDASISNPLFNDTDHELTLGYYANGDCLTRFSLDTDWRKAVAAVATEIGKLE